MLDVRASRFRFVIAFLAWVCGFTSAKHKSGTKELLKLISMSHLQSSSIILK
jgi:hypothetical protein